MNKIVYHNFAPKTAENAAFSSESSSFENTVSLIEESEPVNFASFENAGIDLLDTSLCLASDSDNVGFVSSEISGADRSFPNGGIKLVFDLNGSYSGPGITLHFWQNICPAVTVEFFKDGESLFSGTFRPTSSDFFCEAPAERYNRLILTFAESEIPYQFVKLKSLDFGKTSEITEFFGAINIFEEIKPDCSDLPCDTCDFEAIIPRDITPQVGQNFFVHRGAECFGKFTTEKLTEDVERRFSFEASDDKKTLGNSSFPSFSASTVTVDFLLNEIYKCADISVDNGGFGDTELTGFIKSDSNARYAAAMLSMGGGFFISSARNKKLRLFKSRDRRANVITSDRIFDRAEYIKNAPYTSIKLLVHGGSEFDNNTATPYTVKNEAVNSNIAVKELTLDKYSLFADPKTRLAEIAAIGFERNEIRAEIILDGEMPGDLVCIETPHGTKTGIIESLDISLQGTETTADIVIIETEGI